MKSLTVKIPDDATCGGWLLRALNRWSEQPAANTKTVAFLPTHFAFDVEHTLAAWCLGTYSLVVNDSFAPNQVRVEVHQ